MRLFLSALGVEILKARRSLVSLLTVAGFMLLPLVAGLFMIILKDPERARAMGLISVKAQLAGGTADWQTFFDLFLQGTAVAGAVLFSIITAWVFGREFADRTAKDWLALPTPRAIIIGAKFVVTALWILGLIVLIFFVGLGIGSAVDIPGWSFELQWTTFGALLAIAFLSFLLMPFVALFASVGRGYLLPLGWAFLTLALAQITAVIGWGDWFPWAVPALFSGMVGPRAEQLGVHSYVIVSVTSVVGFAATFWWWHNADQTR